MTHFAYDILTEQRILFILYLISTYVKVQPFYKLVDQILEGTATV